MIFYVATNEDARRVLCTTKEEAGKIDKSFVQLDIPTDKAGLRDAIQELLDLADAAGSTQSQIVDSTLPEPQIAVQAPLPVQTPSQFREMVENEWPNHPFAWRFDMACITLEEARKVVPWTSPVKSQD